MGAVLTALYNNMMDDLADLDGLRGSWRSHVLPVCIEVSDSSIHKHLRVVTETGLLEDSVTAKRVLARLFKINDSLDVPLFELLDNIVLFNQSLRRPLRADDQALYPFAVQT